MAGRRCPRGAHADMKMPADCMSPELFAKMARKIAQLTKVVYTLSTRVEDQEALMLAMKQLHEEDVQRVVRDANEKVARCQSQVSRQVALLEQLEGALVHERQERCRLEGELHRRLLQPTSTGGQLLALCAELRDAGLALRSKLDAFERLQLHVALALEGVPVSGGLPLESSLSRALVDGQADDDCVLRKNDFLRDHCDQLAEENERMRSHFEGQLAELRSFYEESLSKLQSSRRLELANDASLLACCAEKETTAERCRMDALLLQLAHSEQQVDRYCKEAKALSDELEKRDKHLKVMDDQVSGSQEELQRLTGRLKQSEAALHQLRTSCALHKQDGIAKAGMIASLEATAGEQQSRLEQLLADAEQLAPLRDECSRLREQLAVAKGAVAKHQADSQRELSAKQHKLEELERRLNTFRDESKCLKLIQAQLKDSLFESENKVSQLTEDLDLKTQALNAKERHANALWEDVKKLKWEVTEAIEEKEALLSESRRLLDRTQREINNAWESKLKSELATQRALGQLDDDRALLQGRATEERTARVVALSERLEAQGQQAQCDRRRLEERLEQTAADGAATLKRQHEGHNRLWLPKVSQGELGRQAVHRQTFRVRPDEELFQEQTADGSESRMADRHLKYAEEQDKLLRDSGTDGRRVLGCHFNHSAFERNNVDHSGNISELKNLVRAQQENLGAVSLELDSKKEQVLRIRSEATQQIKNLELYWQRRITKELNDSCTRHEQEKKFLQENYAKTLTLLKDRIAALEKRAQGEVSSSAKHLDLCQVEPYAERVKAEDGRQVLEERLPPLNRSPVSGYDSETSQARAPSAAVRMPTCTATALCSPRLLKKTAPEFSGGPPPHAPRRTPSWAKPPVALPPRTAELQSKRSVWFSAPPADAGRTAVLRRVPEGARHSRQQ
ncbi:protein FAM184A-like isoform X2 [Amblyomma americanum]